jgi:hypothetical protein
VSPFWRLPNTRSVGDLHTHTRIHVCTHARMHVRKHACWQRSRTQTYVMQCKHRPTARRLHGTGSGSSPRGRAHGVPRPGEWCHADLPSLVRTAPPRAARKGAKRLAPFRAVGPFTRWPHNWPISSPLTVQDAVVEDEGRWGRL